MRSRTPLFPAPTKNMDQSHRRRRARLRRTISGCASSKSVLQHRVLLEPVSVIDDHEFACF